MSTSSTEDGPQNPLVVQSKQEFGLDGNSRIQYEKPATPTSGKNRSDTCIFDFAKDEGWIIPFHSLVYVVQSKQEFGLGGNSRI